VIVTVVGNVRVPASVVDAPSEQTLLLLLHADVNLAAAFSTSVCVVLLHVPPGSDASEDVMVHSVAPGAAHVPDASTLATKLTLLSPTTVVLEAPNVHGDAEVRQAWSLVEMKV
jgi:hypothetical protein